MIIWTQLPLFLYSGTLEVVLGSIVKQNGDLVRNAVVDTRTKGSYFGDIALIWDRTRSATLRCKNNVKIWRLSRNDFLRFISHSNRLVKDLFGGMKWTLIRISYWNLWHIHRVPQFFYYHVFNVLLLQLYTITQILQARRRRPGGDTSLKIIFWRWWRALFICWRRMSTVRSQLHLLGRIDRRIRCSVSQNGFYSSSPWIWPLMNLANLFANYLIGYTRK